MPAAIKGGKSPFCLEQKKETLYKKEGLTRNKRFPLLFLTFLFAIFLSCVSKSLPDNGFTILSPKANDVIKRGSTYEIQWKADPTESEFGAMVTVEFSKDGGKSWDKMEENVPNKGQYKWNVPNVDSTECKILFFSQRGPTYRGTSEMFSVK